MRKLSLPFAAIVCALGGIALYPFTLGVPFLRSSGLAIWVGLALGLAFAIAGLRPRPTWSSRAVLVLCALLTGASLYGFIVGQRLPPGAVEIAGDAAPDTTLPDQDGVPVTLSERWKHGPMLLVFYRGSW